MSTAPRLATFEGLAEDEVIFSLSVDVEESWDWSSQLPNQNFDVANAGQLAEFQQQLNGLGVHPTYFCTYAMLDDPQSRSDLQVLAKGEGVEMAAHLHPWCNPPHVLSGSDQSNDTGKLAQPLNDKQSYLFNLPVELVEAKLVCLVEKFSSCFGYTPESFRSGRWGIDARVLKLLRQAGFAVDSSHLAYYRTQYFDCGNAPSQPYWSDTILNLPASGGYTSLPFDKAHKRHVALSSPGIAKLKLNAVLSKLGIQRQVFLSPEFCQQRDLLKLVENMLTRGDRFFHMSLHSSSLEPGKNQYIQSAHDKQRMFSRLSKVVQHLTSQRRVRFLNLSQVAEASSAT